MRARSKWNFALLAAAALLSAACSKTDPGVAAKVEAKLASDNITPASKIEVTADNYVVTLKGTVDSEEQRARALDLARNTEGVRDVVDMIAVRTSDTAADAPNPDRTLGETIDDAGITMRVKSRLLDDPTVKGLNIDVDTRQGVVYITGSVRSDAEKDQAIKLAREAEGVRDVQADLKIERS
jgi:osmotically-inducible protein OsmY